MPSPPHLNRYQRDSFYVPGAAEGYVDYPSMDFEAYHRGEEGSAYKQEFEGMVSGQYALVDQSQVGTSLQAMKLASKL